MQDFRNTLSSSISLVFLMTLPSACGLVVLGEPIIRLLYSHGGAFHESDVPMTAWALSGYAIGLTGYAAIKVLSPAFYALDDAKTPMIIAVASIAVNAVASYFLMRLLSGVFVSPESPNGIGHVGVALATSCVALVNFFALVWFMRGKIKRLNGREVFASFMKIAAASAVMSVVAYSSFHFLTAQFPAKTLPIRLLEAFVPIGLAGVAFVLAAKILRVSEMEKLFGVLRRRIGSRG
jgi:putative peptidoglycan lipid II flippase